MKNFLRYIFSILFTLFFGTYDAYASGGPSGFIDFFDIILNFFGFDKETRDLYKPVLGSVLTLVTVLIVGLIYKNSVYRCENGLVPDGKLSVKTIIEAVMSFIDDLVSSIIGESKAKPFLPVLSGVFIFIFISNLYGLIPGFIPTTENINTNLAIGLIVFLFYNYSGIREHGLHYIKQFLGPVVFLMPLMFVIEVVAHLARPVSLSLRLLGNIFGDHLVLSVFTELTWLVLPSFLLFFGLLVACIQSFVFTLLSSIYVSMAISHDH